MEIPVWSRGLGEGELKDGIIRKPVVHNHEALCPWGTRLCMWHDLHVALLPAYGVW